MKRLQRLYFILSYVFFILPPFIWGLVALYAENPRLEIHVISLFVNLIVLAVIGFVIVLLIKYDKLHVPSTNEYKQLAFGLVGNVVVYFYTFQNMMEIQNIITIYLILLIVLAVRVLLITRKIVVYELWILLPIFLAVDTLHLLISGCGFTNIGTVCYPNQGGYGWLYFLYVLIAVTTIGYYGYKIYLYKRYTFFGIVNMGIVVAISIAIQRNFDADEKLIGTLFIGGGFFLVLDFIVSIVNKTYTHKILLFYIRTSTFLLLWSLLSEEQFFYYGRADEGLLALMVVVTYVSLGVNILKSLLHVKEEADEPSALDQFTFRSCTFEDKELIKTKYGEVAYNHISLDEEDCSLVALEGERIIGFVSTYVRPLTSPLEAELEAYMNIIEVAPGFRKLGIASELVARTEQYFRRKGIKQLRGWSSDDKIEAINLWRKLNFALSPTTIFIRQKNVAVEGYYFVKKL